MYKTKLQELCQQRNWGLPKYSSMKDGPDHNPRFKASVSVNSHSFDSPFATRSSKDAQNDAAKLAFRHFTSPPSGSSTPSAELNAAAPKDGATHQDPEIHSLYGSSNSSAELNAGEPNIKETNALGVINGVQSQCKSQLQNYARSKNYDLPLYSSKCEGPAHALRFKATVTVDGRTFESPEFYKSLKEAEQTAAKTALMSLSLDGFLEDGSSFCKNLLHELAQREDFSIPIYKTKISGASHMPTFFSSVEVEGEVFYGTAGKSKKQAEIKAAKVAYAMLKERALSRSTGLTSYNPVADDTLKSSPGLELSNTTHAQHNLNHDCHLLSSPTTKFEELAEGSEDEVQEVNSTEIVSTNANVNSEDSIPSDVMSHMEKVTGKQDSSRSGSVPASPKEGVSLSPTLKHPDVSALQISDSNVGKATETKSYLLCNRVRVYSCIPDIAFPKGITVLPISEDRWVAVSLEFPNEK